MSQSHRIIIDISIFGHVFAQLFKRVSGTLSSDIVVLLMSLVMGMYFVAQVLLWRMNLPLEYRC